MRLFLLFSWLSIGSVALLGCNPSDRVPLGKVSGTVSYQGQPISDGTIILEVPGARSAYGKIINGEISEVTTYDVGDGVPVGKARIAVFATSAPAPAASPAAEPPSDPGTVTPVNASYMSGGSSLLPAKFNDPATSGLEAQISAGDNTLKLEIGS